MRTKILILKLGSIGDVVHAMPAVLRLRRALPDCQIDWLVERYAASILKNVKKVDHVIEIDTLKWRRGLLRPGIWREILGMAQQLRQRKYDAVLDLQGLWKSAFIGSLVHPRQLWGWNRRFLREAHASIFYSRRVDREEAREHVIFEHLRIVEAFLESIPAGGDVRAPATAASIEFDELASGEERFWAGEQEKRYGLEGFVIINPGASWKSKRWPIENYALLIKRVIAELRVPVLVSLGPGESSLGEYIRNHVGNSGMTLLSPTLNQLAALAERARLFVGPDTGPLHVAAASRAPIVGIYASTDPVRNGPFSPQDVTVQQNRCGEFCYRRDCGARRCITAISVDAVFEAIQSRLAQVPAVQ